MKSPYRVDDVIKELKNVKAKYGNIPCEINFQNVYIVDEPEGLVRDIKADASRCTIYNW